MLLVFIVNNGRMITLDMSLALETVETLKRSVEKEYNIPHNKQVLLISGGEVLENARSVCSYTAGTDTNPIYLFNKAGFETKPPPPLDFGDDSEYRKLVSELNTRLTECIDLPATLDTVTQRAKLAQEFHDLAKDQAVECEKLVHDQHLQQQGWYSVLANLDDVVDEIKKRAAQCEEYFKEYLIRREAHLVYLQQFREDLGILERIPLLSSLHELYRQNYGKVDSNPSDTNINASQNADSIKEISILQWLSDTDNVNSLYDNCNMGMQKFDAHALQLLQKKIWFIHQESENMAMKEIKGLGTRLFGLDSLLREVKVHVQQQADMAQSFLKQIYHNAL